MFTARSSERRHRPAAAVRAGLPQAYGWYPPAPPARSGTDNRRVTFLPDGAGYRFSSQTRFDRLFAGIGAPRPSFVSNTTEGTEHIGSADTHTTGYFWNWLTVENGVASLSIPSWNQIHDWLTAMRQLRDSAGFAA